MANGKLTLTEWQLKAISDRAGVGIDVLRDAAVAFSTKTTLGTSTTSGLSCAKCGSTDIMTKFHNSRYACDRSTGTWSAVAYTFEGEHLHKTCRDCGYQWPDTPLDVKTPPAVAKPEFLEPDITEPKVK